jgi:hypothetical protein
VNKVNGKEYVGFHKINDIDDLRCERSDNGSIFEDGYLGSGKLMKRALEKYGPMNMWQELILITESKDEAEKLEREIVCKEWVECEDNYNLSIGGNVTVLFSDKNGFYGKKHTKETIDKIQKARNETYKNAPFSWSKSYLVEDESVVFYNKKEIREYFQIDGWFEVNKLVYEGKIRYISEHLQKSAILRFIKRRDFIEDTEARLRAKEKMAELARERFSGIQKTPESNVKRGRSIKRWIKSNPEKHKSRMEKINKNPEKIEKTAAKHRGMKRSDETRKNISESLKGKPANNKGKMWIHNIVTNEKRYVEKVSEIPTGWKSGMGKRK